MLQGHAPEMVVDGRTLNRILGTASEPLLAELANMCSGVVVCRASPSQKATIVRMMKRFQTAELAGTVSPLLSVQHLSSISHFLLTWARVLQLTHMHEALECLQKFVQLEQKAS